MCPKIFPKSSLYSVADVLIYCVPCNITAFGWPLKSQNTGLFGTFRQLTGEQCSKENWASAGFRHRLRCHALVIFTVPQTTQNLSRSSIAVWIGDYAFGYLKRVWLGLSNGVLAYLKQRGQQARNFHYRYEGGYVNPTATLLNGRALAQRVDGSLQRLG